MGPSTPHKIHTADGVLLITDAGLTKQGEPTWSLPRTAISGASFARREDGTGNDVQLHLCDGNPFLLCSVPDAHVLRLIEVLGFKGAALSATLSSCEQCTPSSVGNAESTADLEAPYAQGQLIITDSHIRLVGEDSWEIHRADVAGVRWRTTGSGCDLVLVCRDGQQMWITRLAHADALNAIVRLNGADIGTRVVSSAEQPIGADESAPSLEPALTEHSRQETSRPGAPPSDSTRRSLAGDGPKTAASIPIDTEATGTLVAVGLVSKDASGTKLSQARRSGGAAQAAKLRRAPEKAPPGEESANGSTPPGASRTVHAGAAKPGIWLPNTLRRSARHGRKILAAVLGAVILLSLVVARANGMFSPQRPLASTPAPTRSAATTGATIYVGSHDGDVYALSARSGTLVWQHRVGGAVESCPTYAGGMVYAGSDDGSISAIRVTDHAVLWHVVIGGKVIGAPAVSGGVVYAGSSSGSLYALRASDATILWRYPSDNWFASQPTVTDGVVYAGNYDGNIYALDARSGALRWSFHTGGPVAATPTIADGIVYAGSVDGSIYALNAHTGALKWHYATGGSIYSSPAVAGSTLYVGSFDGAVYALSTRTLSVLWRYQTNGPVASSPAVAGSTLYAGSFDGAVYALHADSGALVWRFKTGGSVASSPAVANNTVFIGSDDHNVYALTTSMGLLLWSYRTGGVVAWRPAVSA